MQSAKKYAEVALRKAWADLLLKIGLRERSAEAYDEALVRAAALALDYQFEPVEAPVAFACEHMSITGTGYRRASCWHGGCEMKPVWASQTNRAAV